MLIANPVSVTLDYVQWMYFLGWCEAKRQPAETATLLGIFKTIQDSLNHMK